MQKKLFPNNPFQVILLLVLAVLIASPPTFAIYFSVKPKMSQDLLGTISYIFFFISIISLTYLINKRRKIAFSLDFKPVSLVLISLMIGIVIFFQLGFSAPFDSLIAPQAIVTNPFNKLVFMFGAIFLGPVCEEILFRGIILKGLLTRYSPIISIVLSALIFGVIHVQPAAIVIASLIGLFLGWVYYETKSIGATILLHATANISAFAGQYLTFNISANPVNMFNMYGGLSVYIIILFLGLLVFSFFKLYQRMKTVSAN